MFLEELPDDVRAELLDPEFEGRQHYSRATYALGCHGPLCRLREKHRGRLRNQVRAEAAGREYVPSHALRDTARDAELVKIATWHIEGRRAATLAAAVQ